jgi:hypothetical protein
LVAFRAVIRSVRGRAHSDDRQLRSIDPSVAEEVVRKEALDPTASASIRMAAGGMSDEPLELEDEPEGPESSGPKPS